MRGGKDVQALQRNNAWAEQKLLAAQARAEKARLEEERRRLKAQEKERKAQEKEQQLQEKDCSDQCVAACVRGSSS